MFPSKTRRGWLPVIDVLVMYECSNWARMTSASKWRMQDLTESVSESTLISASWAPQIRTGVVLGVVGWAPETRGAVPSVAARRTANRKRIDRIPGQGRGSSPQVENASPVRNVTSVT